MMGPISTLGRAAEASVKQKEINGMPPDQAVAYTEQLLLDGISPDLETMMVQAAQLRQMQRRPPQMTIRDQLNQAYQGIANLPTPGFQPGFAGGGIVAFASGDLVDDMMPRLTPEQIRNQMLMQQRAEAGLRFRQNLATMGLGDFPELIEDVPESERVVTRTVDDKGNLWEKTKSGEWRQARQGVSSSEFGLKGLRNVESPMRREVEAWRKSQGMGGEGIRGGATPPPEAPETPKSRVGGLGTLAGAILGGSAITAASDLSNLRRIQEERGIKPERDIIYGAPEFEGEAPVPMPGLSEIGDFAKATLANVPILGAFFDNPYTEETKKAETKPKPEVKPAAPKPKPSGGMAPAAKPRGGMFDIPIAIETARATLNYAVKEDDEFQKLLKRSEAEGTGPYSKMFTEGDRIKTERIEALKKSKESNFGRALVAAGLAMAQQAAKGGQPGNESQKFLAAAVEGLGGYMKAQEFLSQEQEKAQKELDKFTMDMEQLREASRGDLRGLALKRFNDAQARAEKANDNARGLMIVQAQLETSMGLAQAKAASSLQNAQIRAQSQLMAQAQKEVADSPAYMAAQMKYAQATQAKNPKEQQAALTEMNNLIQQRVQMNMQIPSYMAGIQYNPASGDLDFSAVDAIVESALGTGK